MALLVNSAFITNHYLEKKMRSLRYVFIACLLVTNAWSNSNFNPILKPQSTYTWSLPAPGAITLYRNISQSGVGFIYTNDRDSDMVVIRCPLNDVSLQANQTYACFLSPGESAKIELKLPYFSRGAHGTYALLF
jgi:hypothetical protein